MSKIAFLYPGQGAQVAGMGKDFYEQSPLAKEVFDKSCEILGQDMKHICFEENELLDRTDYTQAALVTTCMAMTKEIMARGLTPDMTAGLSLGEYTAHVASGSMEFTDAVKLVKKRGKYMQEEVPLGVGAMAAIIALTPEDVKEICKQASSKGICEPANFNCPGQITVAGEVAAVEYACELAKEKGAKRAMLMPVSAPFHCSMLKGAGEKLGKELENVTVSEMDVPIITNVTGDYIKSKDEIKELLVRQVSSSVLFEESLKRMIADGVDTFIEIGPGKALSGFVKRIDKTKTILNIEDMASLEKTKEALSL